MINKHFLLAALAITTMAGCSNDDGAVSADMASDIIQIQPSIGAQIATRTMPAETDATKSTQFTDGDTIMVSKDSVNFYAYAFDGGTWTPVRSNHSSAYLKWGSTTDTEINLQAYYPASASMGEFELPQWQNTADDIKAADFMTFNGKATRGAGNAVTLAMQRRTARVRVTIDKFGDEFDRGAQCLLHIYSPYGKVKVTYNGTDADVSGDGQFKKLFPINVRYIKKDEVATALVVPSAAQQNQDFIYVEVYDSTLTPYNKELFVRGIPAHEAGYSYDYRLTVGKDTIAISSVTVSPWTEGPGVTTDGVEAEESIENYTIKESGNTTTYHVYSAKGLKAWADSVCSTYSSSNTALNLTLEDDIDLTGVDMPYIGEFAGTIDGQGHTIEGLTINPSNLNNAGALINDLSSGGVVKNVTFNNVNIISNEAASVIAHTNKGRIENCVVSSGTVEGSGTYVGGVVAENMGTIIGCVNNANVTSKSSTRDCYVGGIVGQNASGGVIIACANTGTIKYSGTQTSYSCGGVVGCNFTKIYGSWTAENGCGNCIGGEGANANQDHKCQVLAASAADNYQAQIDDMNIAIDTYNSSATEENKCKYQWEASATGYPKLQ